MPHINKLNGVAVVTLSEHALCNANFSHEVNCRITAMEVRQVVVDLNAIDVLTSEDIDKLLTLITLLKLGGAECMVCGLSPLSIAVLVNFIDDIPLPSALNVERAIHALSH